MKVFITDGTAAGFYTAVFLSYREKDAVITSQENRQLSFDTEVINVETDSEKAAPSGRQVPHGLLTRPPLSSLIH